MATSATTATQREKDTGRRRMGRSYEVFTQRATNDLKHTSQRKHSKKKKEKSKGNPPMAKASFSSAAAKSMDQRLRKRAVTDLAPRLVDVFANSEYGATHIVRDMKNKKKKWLRELTIRRCADDLLSYVLQYVTVEDFTAQVLDAHPIPISPELLTIICAYVSPGCMRVNMKFGSSKEAFGASTTFAGAIASQPMATFAPGFGVNKLCFTKNKKGRRNSQQCSQYYPISHMILFLWFRTQLPDGYTTTIDNPRCYITILLNCWSRLHGGKHNRERKTIGHNNHDTLVTHCGQFSGGHFVCHLTSEEKAAVGNIGAVGTCANTGGSVTVDCDFYHWGASTFVPSTGTLSGTHKGVGASKLYTVSAKNVVLATTSNKVHGACDFVLDTEQCVNPCKFTVVCAVRGSNKPTASPSAKNVLAVFSKGFRVNDTRRPQVKIKRVTMNK